MSSLLDPSALTDLAERLVSAARRAGADAADAVAVRSVSLGVEVRDGAVEESERSEGDDVGLRVLLGRRQAVVSTNDVKADVSQLAHRALAMARAAPEDPFVGLADPGFLARDIPDLDLLDPELPSVSVGRGRAMRQLPLESRRGSGRCIGIGWDRRNGAGDSGFFAARISVRVRHLDDSYCQ
jgi:PmbA protein